jgi:putative transposase
MRLARLYAPGLPQLVQASFTPHLAEHWRQAPDQLPFERVIDWLRQCALAEGVRLHGWSLCPQALLLLVTPAHRQSISRLIQSLGRHLSAHIKSGSVFSGRYRNCILEPGHWVLPALVWLESAPARAGFAPNAVAWRWSSAGQHCGEAEASRAWVQDHHDYWSCGNTPFDRQAGYRKLLMQGLSPTQERAVELALKGQWALGSDTFVRGLENVASRRAVPGQRGRPRKSIPASLDEPSAP